MTSKADKLPLETHDFDVKAWGTNLVAPYSTDNRSIIVDRLSWSRHVDDVYDPSLQQILHYKFAMF